MNFFDFFKANKKTATTAKERLQIVVSHERKDEAAPDFLPELRRELLKVIGKYIHIDPNQIHVNLQKEDNCSILELNVTLPEKAKEEEESLA